MSDTPPGPVAEQATKAPATSGRIQYPRWLWVVGFVVMAVLVVGIVALVRLSDQADPTQAGGPVEALIPTNGSQILQQETVGIDLAPGFDARLTINGIDMPADQVTAEKGLNTFTFTPRPGTYFEQWPAGQTCITATYWPSADVTLTGTRSWCFTVV